MRLGADDVMAARGVNDSMITIGVGATRVGIQAGPDFHDQASTTVSVAGKTSMLTSMPINASAEPR